MTSWTSLTHLFLLVATLDLSEAGCHDYFEVDDWCGLLTETFSIVDTKDPKDMMECSVERVILETDEANKTNKKNNQTLLHILLDCFGREEAPKKISEKCEGGTSQTVTYYHFMCLTAKAINYTLKGCEYGSTSTNMADTEQRSFSDTPDDTVCKLYKEIPATILSSSTPPERTSKTMTTTATQNEISVSYGQTLPRKDSSVFALEIVLLVSVTLNLLEPLAVYLYMRHHRRNDTGRAPPECNSFTTHPYEE